jgi:hypothetical protein
MAIKLTEITFEGIQTEINYYVQQIYNKASQLFSVASPFGQVLTIVEQLHQLSILYLKNAINQYDLSNQNSNNYSIIRSAAIVAGHNPSRAVSASGTIRCQVKVSTNIEEDIPGAQVKILNRTTLKNATNNLLYHIDLGGVDEQVFNIQSGSSFFFNIAQGEWKEAVYTGTGQQNQSYEVQSEGKEVENYKVEVTINGEFWEVKNHLYEMIPNEKACVIQTSFSGGLVVKFGNGNFGQIPPIGSVITINYVETDGQNGNIYRRTTNDWKFVDEVLSGNGTSIDFEKYFNMFIQTDINFGANGEDIELMKNLLPLNTNNFVLALAPQYAYAIRKLGVFSHVNAYNENGTIRIVATPNIRIFKNRNADYFSVDKRAFELDSYERNKLDQYLRVGGYIQLTQKYRIDTPVLSYYVMYINLRLFDDAVEENINNQIIEVTSDYFLNLNRLDRIPRKDIINLISEINGVDSVDVRFVSKKNEDYHKQFLLADENSRITNGNTTNVTQAGYDSKKVLGLDPVLGDIVFEPNEYPVIRGGWTDRNDIFYSETPLDGFSSINISVKGFTERKNVSNR